MIDQKPSIALLAVKYFGSDISDGYILRTLTSKILMNSLNVSKYFIVNDLYMCYIVFLLFNAGWKKRKDQ